MQADDEEKAAALQRQQERVMKRRKSDADTSELHPDDEGVDKKQRHDMGESHALAMHSLVNVPEPTSVLLPMPSEAAYLEREKLRMDMELQKERMRLDREREREEQQQRRDETFIKLVQEQLQASQTMLQAAQAMMLKIIDKLNLDDDNSPK